MVLAVHPSLVLPNSIGFGHLSFVICHLSLVIDLVICHLSFVICHWSFVWSFVICHLSFVIGHLSCHLSFVICHLSLVICHLFCHLSFVICHWSFVICHFICHLSFVIGHLSFVIGHVICHLSLVICHFVICHWSFVICHWSLLPTFNSLLLKHLLPQLKMSHTNDSLCLDFLLGKLYDIWGILSHKLLAVVRGVLADGGDVQYLLVGGCWRMVVMCNIYWWMGWQQNCCWNTARGNASNVKFYLSQSDTSALS